MRELGRENYRVEVEIRPYGGFQNLVTMDDADAARYGNEMIEQIKRHVDSVGDCHVAWDTEWGCENCGAVLEYSHQELECSRCGEKICIYCNEEVAGNSPMCASCWDASQ